MGEIIIKIPKRKKKIQIIKSDEALNEFLEEKKEEIKKRYGLEEENKIENPVGETTKEEIKLSPIVPTWNGLEELEIEGMPVEEEKDEVIFELDLIEERKDIDKKFSINITEEGSPFLTDNTIKNFEHIEVEEKEEIPNKIIFTEIYTVADEKEPIQITNDIKNSNLIDAENFTDNIQTAYKNGYNDAKEIAMLEAREKILEAHNYIRRIDNFMLELRKHYIEQVNFARDKIFDIATTVAEVILETEVDRDKNIVIQQIKRAMEEINNGKVFSIKINPADYNVLLEAKSTLFDNDNISFIKDSKVEKGSCILYTALGIIDATFSTQFSKIKEEMLHIHKNNMPTNEELIISAVPEVNPMSEELFRPE